MSWEVFYLDIEKDGKEKVINGRALPGENRAKAGAGVPSMCNPVLNWTSGIPPQTAECYEADS